MNFKFIKIPTLPKPKLPKVNFGIFKKLFGFLKQHKVSIIVIISIIAFVWGSFIFRDYLLSKMNLNSQNQNNDNGFYSSSNKNPIPTIDIPTPTTSQKSNININEYKSVNTPTPFPTFTPLPTLAPIPTMAPVTTSSSSNSTGNSHCTTGSGTPNTWYSDVYPNPPINVGSSITMQVVIRDCNQNAVQANDKITITLVSGDQNSQINGNNFPYQITTQNGQASFTVSSQASGSVTIKVHDDSSGFDVTNVNNQNPTINFGGNSGNSHCTTSNGTPNFWYSDVVPSSPVTVNTGQSVTFTVHIRDCTQADVSSDHITFSLTSSDSSLTINGSSSPVSAYANNGVATFTVTSVNAGTDNFSVHDDSSNFTVTDPNDHNPSVTFTGSSSPTPTDSPTTTTTPTDTPTPTP
jgi:hypothetical protein